MLEALALHHNFDIGSSRGRFSTEAADLDSLGEPLSVALVAVTTLRSGLIVLQRRV